MVKVGLENTAFNFVFDVLFSVDEVKIRSNYLRSGFAIDVMACLPYDALNIFDIVENSSDSNKFDEFRFTTITGDNITNLMGANIQAAASGDSYGNVFTILKVQKKMVRNSVGSGL